MVRMEVFASGEARNQNSLVAPCSPIKGVKIPLNNGYRAHTVFLSYTSRKVIIKTKRNSGKWTKWEPGIRLPGDPGVNHLKIPKH